MFMEDIVLCRHTPPRECVAMTGCVGTDVNFDVKAYENERHRLLDEMLERVCHPDRLSAMRVSEWQKGLQHAMSVTRIWEWMRDIEHPEALTPVERFWAKLTHCAQ